MPRTKQRALLFDHEIEPVAAHVEDANPELAAHLRDEQNRLGWIAGKIAFDVYPADGEAIDQALRAIGALG